MPQPTMTPEVFGKMVRQGMWSGIWTAAKLLWPYFLGALVLLCIVSYLKGRIRRAERDREYRRMAKIFKEVNDETSSPDK